MSIPADRPHVPDIFGTPLVVEPSPGHLASDAGLLPIRAFDRHIGLTRAIAGRKVPRRRGTHKYFLLQGIGRWVS